ncbi:major histocompatibility complex class I-related gene protein-like isoform X2 [Toxotes jaculatrix]|uniref:major histocompatibility complex class I-related gene protein-like isoform X2 n=1 Tax=Toxotes jaculatrix TaxID=941984 RepID=UPI001B3A865A|nr:major histocompatibility complex class I-related gene protein-like isoform X2 [Toxotes jaculatrix]
MKKLLFFFLFCHGSSSVKHSVKYFLTASSGLPNFPEFVGALQVDDILVAYCDTNTQRVEPKQEWVKLFLEKNPEHLEIYRRECFEDVPSFFKDRIRGLKHLFRQSGGVHILQKITGFEWDETTGEVIGFMQFGYDGEDFISFDLKTKTWIALKPEAALFKLRWDADKSRITYTESLLTQVFPELLMDYVDYGKIFLLKTERPSVSLLQKTPSSPLSCHATGFYPDRAEMFWRKDGEELHEDVEHGEILPNHDGTFQMSVDLNISSVTPEDWGRYECVFHLSGVKEDIVTKLDKAEIRTNWGKTGIRNDGEKPTDRTVLIIVPVVVFIFIFITVIGFMAHKKKKATRPPPSSDNDTELSTKLNPET